MNDELCKGIMVFNGACFGYALKNTCRNQLPVQDRQQTYLLDTGLTRSPAWPERRVFSKSATQELAPSIPQPVDLKIWSF